MKLWRSWSRNYEQERTGWKVSFGRSIQDQTGNTGETPLNFDLRKVSADDVTMRKNGRCPSLSCCWCWLSAVL